MVTADYEGHLTEHPKPHTLTADAVAYDLLAIADAAGLDRFAYYGYSSLALSGLQLALRSNRLGALAMGGYPPLGGPYAAMLAVTRTAHRMALDAQDQPRAPVAEVMPGDWDSVPFDRTPDQTQQYVTLYESLDGFDDRAVHIGLRIPRFAFAGANDNIAYHRIRRGGQFSYRVGLPAGTDPDTITAARKDGVLTVAVPRSDAFRPRRIDIV